MTCKITNCIHETEHGCMGCVKYQPSRYCLGDTVTTDDGITYTIASLNSDESAVLEDDNGDMIIVESGEFWHVKPN